MIAAGSELSRLRDESLSLNLLETALVTQSCAVDDAYGILEGFVMPRRFIISMLGLALALLLTPQVSLAVDEHISQAIEYTKLAIDDGKYGRAEGLAAHAEAALAHAEASERVNANPHTANAINHLKEAIDEGKQGHVDVATTHAEAALNNLQQVM